MKRSDMVKVIEKAMRCWNGAYFNQSLESHILEYIEKAGMLPPYFQGSLTNYDIAMGSNPYRWESEDENK